jgi:hypothetical protein
MRQKKEQRLTAEQKAEVERRAEVIARSMASFGPIFEAMIEGNTKIITIKRMPGNNKFHVDFDQDYIP